LILRAALAPDSDGSAAVAEQPVAATPTLAIVTVLLRQEEHAGSSAYRLLTIECGPDLNCSLAKPDCFDGLKALATEPPPRDTSALKIAATDFLSQQFPDIDFLADKLHCLSACYFENSPTDALNPTSA
jgi:hypothetical protein